MCSVLEILLNSNYQVQLPDANANGDFYAAYPNEFGMKLLLGQAKGANIFHAPTALLLNFCFCK